VNNGSNNGNASSQNLNRTIRFGVFEANLQTGEVRKAGDRIRLQDQPFKVLRILLEHAGDLVTREELQSRIWPEDSFGDFDHAVNIAVGKLRAALGDSAEYPLFIETVPRRGYRFVGKLEGSAAETFSPGFPGIDTDQPRKGWRKLPRYLATASACIVLLGLGAFFGRRSVKWEPPHFQRLTVGRGTIYSARFAPDDQSVIYAASWNGAPIEVFSTDLKFPGQRQLGLSSSQLLAVSSHGEIAVLYPADHLFMFTLQGTLGQAPIAGGSPRQLAEQIQWADWEPYGEGVAVVREVKGKQRLEYPLGHVLDETSGWISHPRFSPKGDQIAFLEHPIYEDDRGAIAVVNLSGLKRTVSRSWESIEGLAWSPDGSAIWVSAAEAGIERSVYAVNPSGGERLVFSAPGGITLHDIAPDGRVLLSRDEDRVGISALSPDTGKEQDLSWRDWSRAKDISKDGKSVLFDEEGVGSGSNYIVAVRDLRGSLPVRLGEGAAGTFSPDGKWVTTVVSGNGLLLLPTGAGNVKHLEKGDIEHYTDASSWMPDGRQVIFTGNRAGRGMQCFIQNVDSGAPHPVTPEGFTMCQVSSDGKTMAANNQADNNKGWFYEADGAQSHPVPGLRPGEHFSWTSDPHYLYAFNGKQIPTSVYRLNVDTGERQFLLQIKPQDVAGLVDIGPLRFSSDYRSYVYSYTRLLSELYVVSNLR
jgi:eukaryotic-like serine/threonine-protein kinase